MKEPINKTIKIKNFCSVKDKRTREDKPVWEKIFSKETSDKRLILYAQRTLKSQQKENKQPN